ncbi:DUF4351 domain-containing protein [Capilliphycus salinus ALCB114379]|uniref:DUF4351 domain-containing protein n=1 Tax=Capilliphycus salinus TaxID=2768948 RepID=UPI0039A666C2
MKESVIYQDILQKGRQEGRQEGLLQGEASLIIRLLTRRFGEVDPQLQQQIRSLSISQLETLGEALLDFTTLTDVTAYLEQIQDSENIN